jgi:UDP-N-acetylmuramyl pentapeptide phosphotransferase/UDP-N-acetylglucosamine-1-phosphate transferase
MYRYLLPLERGVSLPMYMYIFVFITYASLCVLRRTCKQNRLYETLFHTVTILSKHNHHHHHHIYAHINIKYTQIYPCKYT